MNIAEFDKIYDELGEVLSALVAPDVDEDFTDFVQKYPQFSKLWGMNSSRFDLSDWWAWVIANDGFPYSLCPSDILTGESWAFILRNKPELAEFCDWEKLDKSNWLYVTTSHPNLAVFCPNPDLLDTTIRHWSAKHIMKGKNVSTTN